MFLGIDPKEDSYSIINHWLSCLSTGSSGGNGAGNVNGNRSRSRDKPPKLPPRDTHAIYGPSLWAKPGDSKKNHNNNIIDKRGGKKLLEKNKDCGAYCSWESFLEVPS